MNWWYNSFICGVNEGQAIQKTLEQAGLVYDEHFYMYTPDSKSHTSFWFLDDGESEVMAKLAIQ